MARSLYVLMCLAALAAASQAEALQLTNRDTAEHKIALTEPAGTQEVLIKPSQVIDGHLQDRLHDEDGRRRGI